MRIVYCGNFLHSWCTEVHVARDAERIPGVEVVRVQEPQLATLKFLDVIRAAAQGAELLIYQRTWGLPMEAIDLWDELERDGCQTVSYHLDLYVGLQRAATIADDPFWRTGVVFTADGDPSTTEQLATWEIDHRWLPAACVSNEIVPGTPCESAWRGIDLVFVGSAPQIYHREWPWRKKLLAGLEARYGRRFRVLPVGGKRLHGLDLNDLYATVPVVIGDSLALPGHRNYWSDRFYETVGRGGYLIGPNVPGIETQFTSGDHLDLYEIGDPATVIELVDHALDHRDEAREIARAGQAHVREHHTYTDRIRTMLDSLGLAP